MRKLKVTLAATVFIVSGGAGVFLFAEGLSTGVVAGGASSVARAAAPGTYWFHMVMWGLIAVYFGGVGLLIVIGLLWRLARRPSEKRGIRQAVIRELIVEDDGHIAHMDFKPRE